MNVFDTIGTAVLQQHEGNEQLASLLADGVRVLTRRLGRLLNKVLRNAPGEHQPR